MPQVRHAREAAPRRRRLRAAGAGAQPLLEENVRPVAQGAAAALDVLLWRSLPLLCLDRPPPRQPTSPP